MRKNKKFLKAGAVVVSIVIMAVIFIIGFTSAYIAITGTSKESQIVETIKIEQIINSGIERFKYEVYINGFNIDKAECDDDLWTFSNGDYSYTITCLDLGNEKKFYVSGTYKNKTITKEIKIF